MSSYDWEDTFSTWAKPPGKTEQDRCENAEKAIKNAIAASEKMKNRNVKVFTQGSYRNNTNVRKDSDVDICILCYDTFFYDLPEEYSRENFDIIPATYNYPEFKNDVGEALNSYFGSNSVKRGNKAFNIKENSYHVEADVAPFFEHRRYHKEGNYLSGVELSPDKGERVINWPEQHYRKGVNKNNETSRRFKSLVRILKALCFQMQENGNSGTKNIPGFLIECLVWNVPNDHFGKHYYTDDVRSCLVYLFNNTMNNEQCCEWGEVSELIYLFHNGQKWTREQAHNFLNLTWNFIGFE